MMFFKKCLTAVKFSYTRSNETNSKQKIIIENNEVNKHILSECVHVVYHFFSQICNC